MTDPVKVLSDDEVQHVWANNKIGELIISPEIDVLCATVRALSASLSKANEVVEEAVHTNTALREQLAQSQSRLREQRETIKFWQRHIARMGKLLGTVAMDTEVEEAVKQLQSQLAQVTQQRDRRPKIICLCGSTRFIEQFAIKTWELEREGFIVLGCTLLPMWYCQVPSHFGEATGTKEQCDELHLRKIDLADEVLVLNIGGYIGESTANEIAYATRTGKPVNYIEEQP